MLLPNQVCSFADILVSYGDHQQAMHRTRLSHPCWRLLQADVARKIKEECEAELAVAMPILEDALAALDTIKEADITYIRKLGNPPAAIKLVMEVKLTCLSA